MKKLTDLRLGSPEALESRFEMFARECAPLEPDFLGERRRRAFAAFAHHGMPKPRDEEWRFTDVSPILAAAFTAAPPEVNGAAAAALPGPAYPGTHGIVLVNGRRHAGLSDRGELPAGVEITGVMAGDLAAVHEIGRHVDLARAPFAALNTAFFADALVIRVREGVDVERPIHVTSLTAAPGAQALSYPRILIVAEANSRVRVIESHAGPAGAGYLTCPVTEVVVGVNADVDHYKVQVDSLAAFHMGMLQVTQERDSRFATHSISTGGALVRHDVRARIDGAGADAVLNGLYVVEGTQHVDTHMLVEHLAPNCTSHELYKGVLDGKSRGVFNGRIFVAREAQKTDAVQANRNLLLSREALVNSNPQLEIFADDVRCTHGSTIGQLDDDAMFYLRSRGIGADAARSLLVYAFAVEIVDGIRDEGVRSGLAEFLFDRLPRGDVVRQAV